MNPIIQACDLLQGGARWIKSDTPAAKSKRAWGQVRWNPNPYTTAAQNVFGSPVAATSDSAFRYTALGAIMRACGGWRYRPAMQALYLAINPSLTPDETAYTCQDILVAEITDWNNSDSTTYKQVRLAMHRAAGLYEEIR